jgi:hypothetical protein
LTASPEPAPAAGRGSWIPRTGIKRSDLTQVPGKLAEPSDDGPHPGSTTEWWYTHVMDPATRRTFIAMLFTAPVPTAVIFWYPERGAKTVLPEPTARVTAADGPTVESNANDEPLMVNTVGSWQNRPGSRTRIPNLFMAGDYVRTHVDLATMEGANESGRAAVNALLDAAGSPAERVPMWELYQPPELDGLKMLDAQRCRSGLPNLFDTLPG